MPPWTALHFCNALEKDVQGEVQINYCDINVDDGKVATLL
jgi:hypothetical protein